MSLITLALVVIGAIAAWKWFRKSYKKHPVLWVLGIVAVIALVVIF